MTDLPPANSGQSSSAAIGPHELDLAWAHDDPGIVHLRRRGGEASDATLCGKSALNAFVSRRKVSCRECMDVTTSG